MKLLSVIIFTIFSLPLFGQIKPEFKTHPFQVLHAERVLINGKKQVEQLQLISTNDYLNVLDSGALTLVHFTGKVVEFEGVQNINIKEVAPMYQPSCKYDHERPALKKLTNISNRKQGLERKISGSAERPGGSYVSFLFNGYPFRANSKKVFIHKNDKIIVNWFLDKPENKRKYLFKMVNIFDELIFEQELTDSKILLDFKQLEVEGIAIIYIDPTYDDRDFRTLTLAINLENEHCELYFQSDEFDTAIEYLIYGLIQEDLGDFERAKINYTKAFKMGSKKHEELIKNNFLSFMNAYEAWVSKW